MAASLATKIVAAVLGVSAVVVVKSTLFPCQSCNVSDFLIDRTAAAAAPTPDQEFTEDHYFKRHAELKALEGKAPPKLTLRDWIGEEQDLDKLKGKVVVVDFWGVWCGPCCRAVPKNIAMYEKYKDKGLVFIGVHSTNAAVKMPQFAKENKINYSLAVDVSDASAKAWQVKFWPTYCVIDRAGIVRAAGLKPDAVSTVVEKLLEEPAPAETTKQPV